ncbi:MAG TPA: site-specific integrase [Vicinamibacterales bacterium]|nr:site-specific integrase [Vicinamibacterales bacterium]
MSPTVYKICTCRDRLKCRHPWWFSFKRRGSAVRFRKSLDVVLETHVDSKTVAIEQANRLRQAIIDNALTARERELIDPKGTLLPPAPIKPIAETLTVRQLLAMYEERHLAHLASPARHAYQVGAIVRQPVNRPDGTAAAFGDWLVVDVNADVLERLREGRRARAMRAQAGRKESNAVGGEVAANRDLRMLRAAFNWAVDKQIVERTPFKRADRTIVRLTRERARSRRLQPGEQDALLAAIDAAGNTFLRALVEAALETGCRKGELLTLQWHQVTLDGARRDLWLPADKTKTARARRVPISDRLKVILEMRQTALRVGLKLADDEQLDQTLYVFGNEIGQRHGAIKTAWQAACARAKLQDLHFHDLRREAGSRWLEGGVELHTIREWLGHTNIAQTSTYLATTLAGNHAAMKRFDAQRVRLTPIDTAGGTPPHDGAQSATVANSQTQQSATKH